MARKGKTASPAAAPSIPKTARGSRRRSLPRRASRNTAEAGWWAAARPRSSQRFAYRSHRFVLAQQLEPLIEEQRQRSVIMIRGELARAGFERKRVDQLESARRERFERGGQERARYPLPSPLRRDHEADDDRGLEWFAWQGRRVDAHPVETVR